MKDYQKVYCPICKKYVEFGMFDDEVICGECSVIVASFKTL